MTSVLVGYPVTVGVRFGGCAAAVVVGAIVVGAVVLVERASVRSGWLDDNWAKVIPLATAAVAYRAAVEFHGSGFIAAFVAGLVYGQLMKDRVRESINLTEDLGQFLSGITFLLFGAVIVGRALTYINIEMILYALLSLTVIRMIPVAVSLTGSGSTRQTKAFTGWFGPPRTGDHRDHTHDRRRIRAARCRDDFDCRNGRRALERFRSRHQRPTPDDQVLELAP